MTGGRCSTERKEIEVLLASEKNRWKKIDQELAVTARLFGEAPLGLRRTEIARPPAPIDLSVVSQIEREPLTVLLSREGWIRAVKGHELDPAVHKFKEGDAPGFAVACHTTDRLGLFLSDGRAFTLKAVDLPRGRGFGQPIRVLADLPPDGEVVALFVPVKGRRHVLATALGRGMIVEDDDLVAEKKTGKQILNLKEGDRAAFCVPVTGDTVLSLARHRYMLIFPVEQLPLMTRGMGVMIHKLPAGVELSDVRVYASAVGLVWQEGQRPRSEGDLNPFRGKRADRGKLAPQWITRKSGGR